MDISTTSTSQSCEISSSDVTILQGHTSEVGIFCQSSLFIYDFYFCSKERFDI